MKEKLCTILPHSSHWRPPHASPNLTHTRPPRPALHYLHPVVSLPVVYRCLRNTPVAHPQIPLPAVHPPLVQRRGELVWWTVGMGAGTGMGFGVGDGFVIK